ncbi:MAG TPA: FtsX-like permease family protein [Myxococcota bacterium]|nr:FtsX-like permease family protein [Myxococcota bacterium]
MRRLVALAWRSIWRNRRRTIITVVSISLALALSVFFIAFANGMYAKMVDNAVRMQAGHMTIENVEYPDAPAIDLTVTDSGELRKRVEGLPGVERTKALVMGQGVAKSGGGSVGVAVMGIEPAVEAVSSPLAKKLIAGSYLQDGDERKVIVGAELARRLKLGKKSEAVRIASFFEPLLIQFGVRIDSLVEDVRVRLAVGKKLVVSTNNIDGELVEELVRVKGVFETGAVEVDAYIIQLPIDFCRRLYGMSARQSTQIGVLVKNADERDEILEQVRGLVHDPRATVVPWEKVLPDLAAYIEVDGGSNIIFQGIFIFLILFIIFNTILMSVLERKREFAVLLAIGTPPARLKWQILIESAFVGLMGCFFGLGIGGVSAYLVQVYGIDISGLYSEGMSVSGFAVDTILHARLTPLLLAVMGSIVFCATLLISLYPMGQIKRIRLADVLRG